MICPFHGLIIAKEYPPTSSVACRAWAHVINYVVTWNVKTYITHPLKCKMSQKWLKWCSETTTITPKLNFGVVGGCGVACHTTPLPPNSTWLFGLKKFSCQSLGWWGWSCMPYPPHLPQAQLDFLDLKKILVKLWGGGGGGLACHTPPHHPQTWLFGLKIFLWNFWVVGVVLHAIPPTPQLNLTFWT